RVLEDDADPPAYLVGRGRDVQPRQPRRPRGRLQQRAEDLDGGRLAGAVGSQKTEDLARPDGEADAAHRLDRVVALLEVDDFDGRVHESARRRRRRSGAAGGAASARARAATTRSCRGASAQAGSVAAASPSKAKAWQRQPPKSVVRSSQVRQGAGIQASPRKARKPAPSFQMSPSERSRTLSQLDASAAISPAWWQGSATPSGVTTR